MSWEDILKMSFDASSKKRVKLSPEMEKDIEYVVRKLTGDLTMSEKIKEILDINSILLDEKEKVV
jgi:hypothetical protein